MSNALLERDPRLITEEEGFSGYARAGINKVRSGDLGSIPVVVGLALIWIILQSQNDKFLSPSNLVDLARSVSYGGLISLGVVMVLLLGEIDLSIGSMSGLCAAVVGVESVNHNWNVWTAIGLAILVALVLGFVQGFIFSKFNVPSFVVTLAGLLAFLGFQLHVLGRTGTINFPFGGTISNFTNRYFNAAFSYTLVIVALVAYGASLAFKRVQQQRAGVRAVPWFMIVTRLVVISVISLLAIWEFDRDRGLPLGFVIFVAFVILFSVVLTRTNYGRHVFAVGGNDEAARRAGINVSFIRITVFMICAAMAAIGGIMNASYIVAVNQSSGGSDLLLYSIAAAVIGGTSLFGGRGSAWSALLGWLVVGSIQNGMYLLGLPVRYQYMITGAVLAVAATVDALARRGRQTHGRA